MNVEEKTKIDNDDSNNRVSFDSLLIDHEPLDRVPDNVGEDFL